jgi:hypothetical protein
VRLDTFNQPGITCNTRESSATLARRKAQAGYVTHVDPNQYGARLLSGAVPRPRPAAPRPPGGPRRPRVRCEQFGSVMSVPKCHRIRTAVGTKDPELGRARTIDRQHYYIPPRQDPSMPVPCYVINPSETPFGSNGDGPHRRQGAKRAQRGSRAPIESGVGTPSWWGLRERQVGSGRPAAAPWIVAPAQHVLPLPPNVAGQVDGPNPCIQSSGRPEWELWLLRSCRRLLGSRTGEGPPRAQPSPTRTGCAVLGGGEGREPR